MRTANEIKSVVYGARSGKAIKQVELLVRDAVDSGNVEGLKKSVHVRLQRGEEKLGMAKDSVCTLLACLNSHPTTLSHSLTPFPF